MLKNFLVSVAIITLGLPAFAGTTVQQIQSPIYTDDIGRAHFLGRGGYSVMRNMQIEQAQSDVVNDAVRNISTPSPQLENKNSTESRITDIINKRTETAQLQTNHHIDTELNYMQPSSTFDKDTSFFKPSGVNESKTIYTDELGRLHFFGKGNLIKE